MRIVIAGASTFAVSNLGDDAMFAALVQSINRVLPNSEVCLLSRHPSREFDDYFGVRSVQNLEHSSNNAAAGRIFVGLNRGDDSKVLRGVFNEILEADLLLLSGNLFMEVSSNEYLRGVSSYASFLTLLAQVANTPVAVLGLNVVDPIKSELTVQHIRHVFGAALTVGLREESTVDHLRDAGVNVDWAWVVGDPAVGLETPDGVFPNVSVPNPDISVPRRSRPVISLCIRSEYWRIEERPSLTGPERKAVERLLESGAKIRAIPNCTYRYGHEFEDDRNVHRLLFQEFAEEIEFVEDELGVYETVRLLSDSLLHITNRRHSAILAAHAGTPSVVVATSMATHISGFLSEVCMTDALVADLEAALDVAARSLSVNTRHPATSAEAFRSAVDENRSRMDAFLLNVNKLLGSRN